MPILRGKRCVCMMNKSFVWVSMPLFIFPALPCSNDWLSNPTILQLCYHHFLCHSINKPILSNMQGHSTIASDTPPNSWQSVPRFTSFPWRISSTSWLMPFSLACMQCQVTSNYNLRKKEKVSTTQKRKINKHNKTGQGMSLPLSQWQWLFLT